MNVSDDDAFDAYGRNTITVSYIYAISYNSILSAAMQIF